MGIEIEINSMEEMCNLMCDNMLPKTRKKKKQTPKEKAIAFCEKLYEKYDKGKDITDTDIAHIIEILMERE